MDGARVGASRMSKRRLLGARALEPDFNCDGCNLGSMNSDPWGPRLETRPVSVLTEAARAARNAGEALNRMSYRGFGLAPPSRPAS